MIRCFQALLSTATCATTAWAAAWVAAWAAGRIAATDRRRRWKCTGERLLKNAVQLVVVVVAAAAAAAAAAAVVVVVEVVVSLRGMTKRGNHLGPARFLVVQAVHQVVHPAKVLKRNDRTA